MKYYFIEALDTWSFRGNRAFGDAGSYGSTVFPPPPSVIAGAFRSRLLSDSSAQIDSFVRGEGLADHPELERVLGTPDEPGTFHLSSLYLARRNPQNGMIKIFTALPADVMVSNNGKDVFCLQPKEQPESLMSSIPDSLPCLPVLRRSEAAKPESGWLLTHDGLRTYTLGKPLARDHIMHSRCLWADETRVGIGMNPESRSAEDSKLFSLQHTALHHAGEKADHESGLLVGLQGCEDLLREPGMLRLGGDGRAAVFTHVEPETIPIPSEQIKETGRFKLMLQTPGLFVNGWLPDGIQQEDQALFLDWQGVRAQLVCAAVPGYTVVSGWDLARWQPKPAQRAVPAGSVYWFKLLQGDSERLGKLAEQGLWVLAGENIDRQRRAEGYNLASIACW